MSLFQNLKNFDAYAKTIDDFRIRTVSGAAVTLVSTAIVILLLITEFVDYQRIDVKPEIFVDKTRKEQMVINLNVTFPRMPCFLLSLDVMDVTGDIRSDWSQTVFKSRLFQNGSTIDAEKLKAMETAFLHLNGTDPSKDPKYCGSCYGAKDGCCNSCEELRAAYQAMAWALSDTESSEQCKREGWKDKMKSQSTEGCNFHGTIELNKVAGNLHFSVGRSFQRYSAHIHDYSLMSFAPDAEFSHTIHVLSFGEPVPGVVNPLDNTVRTSTKGKHVYHYYIKVVGTEYIYLSGQTTKSNQYSVTHFDRALSSDDGIPGLFMSYEISPMVVRYVEVQKTINHFLTSVCAIVGGIFTVAGLLDAFLYKAERTWKKKIDLGKAH